MIRYAIELLRSLVKSERGQDLIEYALLGGLIAVSIMGVGLLFSGAINSMVTGIGECIDFDNVPCAVKFP